MVAEGCAIVPGPVPESIVTVNGAVPPEMVPVITASGLAVQSNVLVVFATPINWGAMIILLIEAVQLLLSVTTMLWVPVPTLMKELLF